MTTIASDTFTDTNGTTLQSHTPSGGGTWTKFIGGSGVDIEIQSNRASPSGNGACYYHSVTPTTAEYDCQYLQVSNGNANATVGMTARSSTSVETFYLQWVNAVAHFLYKVVAGSYTELGSYSGSTAGNKTIKLEIKDATKRIFIDGVQRISSTNNDITDKGKFGFRCYGTETTVAVDDWQVDEAAAAATSLPPRRAFPRAILNF